MRRLLALLPRTFRRRGLRTVCTLFVRAALNFVGLAVLLPVLALVLDFAGPLGLLPELVLVLDPEGLEGTGPFGYMEKTENS